MKKIANSNFLSGKARIIRSFIDEVNRYSWSRNINHGGCGKFALLLAEIFGLHRFLLTSSGDPKQFLTELTVGPPSAPEHVLTQIESGLYVDSRGFYTLSERADSTKTEIVYPNTIFAEKKIERIRRRGNTVAFCVDYETLSNLVYEGKLWNTEYSSETDSNLHAIAAGFRYGRYSRNNSWLIRND